ncbi:hypothetical protein TcWFU_006927 [Taenia crassiceps]|uniref:Uncharacterized protein n=1 Tax=Taenia crassiceps TaxID=6207 RepID=A0ABR4Q543_9CEST
MSGPQRCLSSTSAWVQSSCRLQCLSGCIPLSLTGYNPRPRSCPDVASTRMASHSSSLPLTAIRSCAATNTLNTRLPPLGAAFQVIRLLNTPPSTNVEQQHSRKQG